jgi:putative membrane protein
MTRARGWQHTAADMHESAGVEPGPKNADEMSVELSSRRTGMSFQRTRMSADRTLMSVIRTSLSLIGFGFTIYQVFRTMAEAKVLTVGIEAPRNFGVSLIAIGMVMLVLGIGYHLSFMYGLRRERNRLALEGLIHAESGFPASLTMIVAFLLLILGAVAIASVDFKSSALR